MAVRRPLTATLWSGRQRAGMISPAGLGEEEKKKRREGGEEEVRNWSKKKEEEIGGSAEVDEWPAGRKTGLRKWEKVKREGRGGAWWWEEREGR